MKQPGIRFPRLRLVTALVLACLLQPLTLAAQSPLRIASPADGTVVTAGQSVSVSVDAGSGTYQSISIIAKAPLEGTDLVAAPPYQFTLPTAATLPSGPYYLTAAGVPASGDFVFSDSITINVERADATVALEPGLDALVFGYVGDKCPLVLFGVFGDGARVLLTHSSLITYASDTPSVATVDTEGMVIAVAPGTATITVTYKDQTVQVPVTVPPPLEVVPAITSLYVSGSEQFIPVVSLPAEVSQSVTWTLEPAVGSIGGDGVYSAPASISSWQGVTVTATSAADPTKSASAKVWVFPLPTVSVSPTAQTMSAGRCQKFTAAVANASSDVNWTVTPAGRGTIVLWNTELDLTTGRSDAWATYCAPGTIAAAEIVTLAAVSDYDNSKSGAAQISLTPSVAISVAPPSAILHSAETQQFAATVNYTAQQAVVWSITPSVGTISDSGLYSAPSVVTYTQSITVLATSIDSDTGFSYTASAVVTLAPQVSAAIPAPGSPAATAVSRSRIDLTWTASTVGGNPVPGYNIFRNGAWVATTTGLSYPDRGLLAAASYSYVVAAYDSQGTISNPSGTVTATTQSDLVANLVAAYDFNEGSGGALYDGSGYGNNGVITAATWNASGREGGALEFNGADSTVTVADSASLTLTSGLTIEAWVKPSAIPDYAWMLAAGKFAPDWGNAVFALFANNGWTATPEAELTVADELQRTLAPSGTLALNTWTHLASTYDGAVQRLYVNGVQVATNTLAAPVDAVSGAFSIGGQGGSFGFIGQIDGVRVYSRALTASEIQGQIQ